MAPTTTAGAAAEQAADAKKTLVCHSACLRESVIFCVVWCGASGAWCSMRCL